MERIISQEERIRRAEEIYQRRKMQGGVRVSTREVNQKNRNEYKLFKKIILQITICLLIYFIFYLIKNSNYIFSESVLEKTKAFLQYDINFQSLYNQYIEGFAKNFNTENKENKAVKLNEEVNEINKNSANEEKENVSNESGGIGGGEEGEKLLTNELKQETEKVSADEQKPLSQMEIDANDIKNNYSLIVPLEGPISSRFGARTPTDVVSANHAGIDIARDEGTVFVASMEGTVTEIINEGGYGNHVYIQNNDVITLYAHCKTIYVKVGSKITQGEPIGEVGHTGNATGPHLHFEIRKENRVVNPEYILNF